MNDGFGHEIKSLKWIMLRYPALLAGVGLASLGVNVLMLTGSIFMLQIYGRVLPSHSVETLVALFVIVAFMFASLGLLELARGKILSRAAVKIALDLRERVFDLISRQALVMGPARAMSAWKDFNLITGFLSGPAVAILFDVPMMIIFFAAIFVLHGLLFYFAIASALLLFAVALFNHFWSRAPQAEAMDAQNQAQGVLLSGLRNIEAIQAMGMRRDFFREWTRVHDVAIWMETRNRERIGVVSGSSKALRMFMQSAMLALGAWLVLRSEINPGVMIVASILLGRALQPVEQSIMLWKGYQQYKLARRRLEQLLARHDASRTAAPRAAPDVAPRGGLRVKALFAAAPGQREPWLKNIHCDLPRGGVLMVAGGNGAGKSMLARVLTGVWPASSGEVLFDGADIRSWPEESLGRLIGYVPQNSQIFEGTIASNIARLRPDADDAAIQEAARKAGAHDLIKSMGGYGAEVGPDGGRLPGGLRQRLALARALYGDPLLLILDEPDASLDPAGRKDLAQAILGMKRRGQTVVLITHDPLLMKVSDFLMHLEGGKVKELRKLDHDGRKKPSMARIRPKR